MFYLFFLKRLDGKVNLGKINCDNHQQICQRALVRAYPTIKYYKGAIDSKRQVNFFEINFYYFNKISF